MAGWSSLGPRSGAGGFNFTNYGASPYKITRLDRNDRSATTRSLTDYAIFGETLYSPYDGTIANLVNDLPNLVPGESDRKNRAGNHILLKCKGADILMAHLLKGRISSQVGSLVKSGDAIAKIGNSGNTGEPHLHIHARKENTGKSTLDGEGLPITFDGKFLVRNSLLVQDELI